MGRHPGITVVTILVVGILLVSGCGSEKPASYDPEKVPARQVKVGDTNISYREYGNGYPLVMLMGLSGTMDTWDPNFINGLSKNNRIVMLDYRGFGKTGLGGKPITMKQYADDTAGLMDALKIARANVLGWSMGTYVAQEFARTAGHGHVGPGGQSSSLADGPLFSVPVAGSIVLRERTTEPPAMRTNAATRSAMRTGLLGKCSFKAIVPTIIGTHTTRPL